MNGSEPQLRELEGGQPSVVVQICRLCFPDGKIASARIQAASPYQDSDVSYGGVVERLPVQYATADSVLLRALFQSFARELTATFQEELIGNWEQFKDDWNEEPPPEECR
jgi:hypothetical protein